MANQIPTGPASRPSSLDASLPGGPSPARPGTAPRVMLLSVWTSADATWHARLVMPDAQTHEFASPFELSRFLSQMPATPLVQTSPPQGLR